MTEQTILTLLKQGTTNRNLKLFTFVPDEVALPDPWGRLPEVTGKVLPRLFWKPVCSHPPKGCRIVPSTLNKELGRHYPTRGGIPYSVVHSLPYVRFVVDNFSQWAEDEVVRWAAFVTLWWLLLPYRSDRIQPYQISGLFPVVLHALEQDATYALGVIFQATKDVLEVLKDAPSPCIPQLLREFIALQPSATASTRRQKSRFALVVSQVTDALRDLLFMWGFPVTSIRWDLQEGIEVRSPIRAIGAF